MIFFIDYENINSYQQDFMIFKQDLQQKYPLSVFIRMIIFE
jgi:hypothetical protein